MRPRRVRIATGNPDQESAAHSLPAVQRALALVTLVTMAVVGLAATNLYLAVDSEAVRAWIASRMSRELNRPVTVGRAHISIWPRPSVGISDLRVDNPAGFDGPPLARVERVRFDVAWLPLVIGRVHVPRLSLDGVRVDMAVDEEGATNFGDLVPAGRESSGGSSRMPLPIRIRRLGVSGGTVTYVDAPGGRSLVLAGAEAEATLSFGERGSWRSSVNARSDSLFARMEGLGDEIFRTAGPTATATLSAGVRSTAGAIDIEEGLIAMAGDTLAVYGTFSRSATQPTFDLLLANEALPADFLVAGFSSAARAELLPRVEGTLGVSLRLHGGAGGRPSMRGALRFDDVALRLRGEPMLDHVKGVVALAPDTVSFDSLTGRFAAGPFELSGTVAKGFGGAAFVVHGHPDLDAFDRLGLLPDSMTLSGDAEIFLSVAGPLGVPDSLAVVGTAVVGGLQLEHRRLGVPIYVPAGEVTLLGREARWTDLIVLVGRDRLTTSGRIGDLFDLWPGAPEAPWIEMSVAGPHLDLNAALPARDSTSDATYAQLALAQLGGRLVDGRTPGQIASSRRLFRPRRLPARGTVDLSFDTLVFRRHRLGGASARVELSDSGFAVSTASFDAWQGHASGSVRVGVGMERSEPFELDLAVEHVDAESFLDSMSPLGEAVSGALDLDLKVTGSTDASLLPVATDLIGEAEITVEDGAVGGTGVNMALADFLGADAWLDVPFMEWVMDIGIKGRVLDIREAELSGEPGAVVFTGAVRLDGSADLSMGVSIPPERLSGVTLRRTGIGQGVLDQLRSGGGSLDVGLRVGGWLQAPTLEPDATNAVALAPTTR